MTEKNHRTFTLKKLLCFVFIISITVMTIGILPVSGEEKIYDDVLRLHVIANSDSQEDQSLKLKVRDAVLQKVSEFLGDCKSFDDALSIISAEKSIAQLTSAAQRVIIKEGYSYPVNVTVSKEPYPKKNYDSLCFPSGTYTSLRVQIGECKGENWWCVLFPRLCLSAASDTDKNEDCFIEAGFTPDQYKIVTDTDEPKYEVRFKILEIIDSLIDKN